MIYNYTPRRKTFEKISWQMQQKHNILYMLPKQYIIKEIKKDPQQTDV